MTNWVTLGTDVMQRSRKSRGLSYEAVARSANVAAKTYERYEKSGRVPEHLVEKFAMILGLEIERPVRERVLLEQQSGEDAALALLQSLDDRLRSLEGQVAGLANASDVQEGMTRLQAAIDELAKGRSRAASAKQ